MAHKIGREMTLLEALAEMHPASTRNTLRGMLDVGRVVVNGKVERRAKRLLVPGDSVVVQAREPQPQQGAPSVRVLYEDERVLVAEKPAGLLTVKTDKGDEDALYDRIFEREKMERRGGRIFIVHRLDRPTSGAILFAKDEEAKDKLQAAFAAGEVERVYHVVVEGVPEQAEGTIDARLAESRSLQVYVTPSAKHGRKAITHYRLIRAGKAFSLVEATLGTGRRHQIRVHMASIGHPVAGDREHGASSSPMKRLALHAASLVFPHPDDGRRVRVASKTPRPFDSVVARAVSEPEPAREPERPKRRGARKR